MGDDHPNHYTINPDMMDLDWANIEFPKMEGIVKMKLSKDGKTQIEIPAGCTIEFIDKNNMQTVLSDEGIYNH
jgi:hypothetical protein